MDFALISLCEIVAGVEAQALESLGKNGAIPRAAAELTGVLEVVEGGGFVALSSARRTALLAAAQSALSQLFGNYCSHHSYKSWLSSSG